MSLTSEPLSYILFILTICCFLIFIWIMFIIKNKNKKMLYSNIYNIGLVVVNIFPANPIYSFIFLLLLICNLLYFLFFILRPKVIERENEDIFIEKKNYSLDSGDINKIIDKNEQELGDS